MCRCGLNPLKDFQRRESVSLCHCQVRTVLTASAILIVLLMMGAESTRNMYSNLAEKNKYSCLKLHHVGYLIKYIEGKFMICTAQQILFSR
jgi:hypothetical protein